MCRAPDVFKADVAMMCGDLTGKAILPIIKEKEGQWYATPYGSKKTFKKQSDLDHFVKFTKDEGFYPYVITPDELAEMRASESLVKEIFAKLMRERIAEWLDMATEKISKNVDIIVNPGNDDDFVIDEVIKNHPRIIYPLKRVVDVHGYPLISMEWVSKTPWSTYRECPDDQLMGKLEEEFARVSDYTNLLCNFHDPPFDSGLDTAPTLRNVVSKTGATQQAVTKAGAMELVGPVGSKSVRACIEKYQPLVGMFGHIHESVGFRNIGRTLCVNPGSEYREGILKGMIINIDGGKASAGRVEL